MVAGMMIVAGSMLVTVDIPSCLVGYRSDIGCDIAVPVDGFISRSKVDPGWTGFFLLIIAPAIYFTVERNRNWVHVIGMVFFLWICKNLWLTHPFGESEISSFIGPAFIASIGYLLAVALRFLPKKYVRSRQHPRSNTAQIND